MSNAWSRWEDWTMVVVGVLAALAPVAVAVTFQAFVVLVVLGVLLALVSLFSLAQPARATASEWVTLVLGVLLFIAPWVMGYVANTNAAWVSWIAGGVAIVVSLIGVRSTIGGHRLTAQH
ncbi:SPW repeat protein [Pseudonocardia acaciae]|uniref:SPW repeat protein n=1 Tax=Pseudonocardia acaciae TaxID=551276 RepID=UPI0005611244|nr:SPW repeat protein [Pseudonocardia acaciae]